MKRCRLVLLCIAVMLSLALACFAHNPAVTLLKIKIESPELDKLMLLDMLQEHGTDNGLKFESVDQDFDYRIVFATGQQRSSSGSRYDNHSKASADVYDSKGKELFKFDRNGRSTDKRATDAVAKEIVKRLLE